MNETDVVARGIATCHPEDTFHLDKGVEIALSRLFNKPMPQSDEIEEGDYVIGNSDANCYRITKKGYVGKVFSVDSHFMNITSVNEDLKLFTVKKDCFDLLAKGDRHE